MSDVQVPDVQIKVDVKGARVALISFYRIEGSTKNWELVAALRDGGDVAAVRAILLAGIAEVTSDGWVDISSLPESAPPQSDEPLPF